MRSANDDLHRLIAAARRKWIAVRAVEHGTGGAVIGAFLAAAATGILWWHGRPSLPIVMWLIGLGAVAGAGMSLLRRPGRIATARRLDDQHRLHDLFSTAIALADRDDPAVAATVRALALAAAARVSAGEPLRIARWDGTAYSAAAMIASLTIAFSAIASQDRTLSITPGKDRGGVSPVLRERSMPTSGSTSSSKSPDAARIDEPTGRRGEDRSLARSTADGGTRESGDPASGRIGATSGDRSTAPPDAQRADGSPPSATGEERSPGGAGEAVGATTPAGNRGYGTVERSLLPPSAEMPGRESITSADRAAADQAIRRGAVPEPYRDLVRAYFSRD